LLVLGIDPGAGTTGYGLVEHRRERLDLVEAGAFHTRPAQELPDRLRLLSEALEALLDRRPPDGVALEGLFVHRNLRSAVVLAQVRGALLLTLARRGLRVNEYSPMEVKKAVTGYGRAAKEQVRAMVLRLLGGPALEAPLDASDALAVAICHAHAAAGRAAREPGARRG
jgi:crossover junction endodeoxyribonuclease RuvC